MNERKELKPKKSLTNKSNLEKSIGMHLLCVKNVLIVFRVEKANQICVRCIDHTKEHNTEITFTFNRFGLGQKLCIWF